MKPVTEEVVFGFDLGTGSIAAVIRHGLEVIYSKSIILKDAEFASTKEATAKRRLARTRLAHRAREFWWNEQAKVLGIDPLKQFKKFTNGDIRVVSVDDRLKREFPSRRDNTIFTSCLLRVMLVEGQVDQLEPWQIYKAVHSAIQKRGYDKDIPWKESTEKKSKEKNEDEDSRISAFVDHLKLLGFSESHWLPCYYEAFRMGIWNPKQGIISIRQSHLAEPAGLESDQGFGYTASREMVLTELKLILSAVKKRYPQLDVDFVIHGPGRVPYASIKPNNDASLKRGKSTDWQGLLGQKIPRFNNRIIGKCSLIPRLNTCRASEALYQEVHLLLALHRFNFLDAIAGVRKLTVEELRKLFEIIRTKNLSKSIAMTKILAKELGARPLAGIEKIPPANTSGRSSFSRPALKMLRHAILSGKSSRDVFDELKQWPSGNKSFSIAENRNPTKGLVLDDLKWLQILGNTPWERIYIPAMRLINGRQSADPSHGVRFLLGEVKDPIVRHRLSLFHGCLKEMRETLKHHGLADQPDHVTIELVREDFMGAEAKKRLAFWQKSREALNSEAKEQIKQFAGESKQAVLRYKLAKQQKFMCPYTGKPISLSNLGGMQIEHIVPQAIGGPDAIWNKVLVDAEANRDKGNRTPWQWLSSSRQKWEQFKTIVANMDLSSKTLKLLLSQDSQDLVERYTHLAESAWIAKLSSEIIKREFSWTDGLGSTKKIHFASGGQTARVRRKYKLDSILSPDKSEVKYRDDIRHHMLDALIITFLRDWDRRPERIDVFELPVGINKPWFDKFVEIHRPKVMGSRSQLEENFYGQWHQEGWMFKRSSLLKLAYTNDQKPKFSQKVLEKRISELYGMLDQDLEVILRNVLDQVIMSSNQEETWKNIVNHLRGRNGSKIRKIKVPQQIADEVLHLPAGELNGRQLVRPKGDHRGFLILKESEKWRAQPVYAWQSVYEEKIKWLEKKAQVAMFIRSGDYISIERQFDDVTIGVYKVLTITNGITMWLGHAGTKTSKDAFLRKSISKVVDLGSAKKFS